MISEMVRNWRLMGVSSFPSWIAEAILFHLKSGLFAQHACTAKQLPAIEARWRRPLMRRDHRTTPELLRVEDRSRPRRRLVCAAGFS